MRRSFAPVAIALLFALTSAVPTIAGEPPRGPDGTPPGQADKPEPTATPAPTAEPTTDPGPTDAPPPPTPPVDQPPTDPAPTPEPGSTDAPPPTDDAPAPADPTPTDPDPADPIPADPTASPAGSPGVGPENQGRGRPDPTDRYIVVLSTKTDRGSLLTRYRQRNGTLATRTFGRALNGFSAHLDAKQRRALLADPNVLAVVPDEVIELAGQTTPTGVSRVGAKRSATAAIDGTDQRVDADVAIVDTGIAKHADLNVAGGYNCSTSDRTLWRDKQGHGTHVAGTVAALDNDIGVVGVAPGARVWAVKILNDDGNGLLSWYVCGLDWILAQRDPTDASRPLFEAVNMSVAKWGSDDRACGTKNDDILHAAICRVVAGGITVVAAAANDSGSAARRVPASYNEVITVSALADTDGKPGGLGGPRCYSWGTYDKDDTFANFSNYGGDVDLIAPGKCIWSTVPGGYGYSSGTSMAAPAVTGAVALYKATRPAATPRQVKEALQYLGNQYWKTSTDPDSVHEQLLDVSLVGKLGTFGFADSPATAATGEAGGTASIPLSITRSSTFFERVYLTVSDLPDGWAAKPVPSSLFGWDADTTTLAVTVPPGTPKGSYELTVTATNQGRLRTTTVPITITTDRPTASAPKIQPVQWTKLGVSTTKSPINATMRISWPAATDPSSAIAGYELQHSVNGGSWSDTRALGPGIRSVDLAALSLRSSHRFRVRAKDEVGNWSPWAAGPTVSFASVGDRSSTLTYKGSWRPTYVDSATNGVRTLSKEAGATVTRTFTGRGIAVIMPRSDYRGKVTIYIDGAKVATVDTYYPSKQTRRVAWSKTWSTSGTHRITIKVNGTSGRPTVSLDGLLITK